MTDEKTTPQDPQDPAFGGDIEDTVVRMPDATSDPAASGGATESYDRDTFASGYADADGAGTVAADAPADDAPRGDAPRGEATAIFATEEHAAEEPIAPAAHTTGASDAAVSDDGVPHQYGIGPFSLREVSLLGVWALAFLFSFFPLWADSSIGGVIAGGATVWTTGIDWVLAIGAPTVAVFLIVLRRFSPDGIRRVGSLGIDQFASVAFSVAAVLWLSWLWAGIARGIATGYWLSSWVVWVEVFLFLATLALTVFAPIIPPFHEDFLHRTERVAHRVARGARPVVARPLSDARFTMAAPSVDPEPAPAGDPIDDDEPAPISAPAMQAFWALSPVDRDVVDENGIPLFRVGPTAWALVIEDRGDSFVIRHEDGRIGYLTDISGVTRG
ncbi:MULTISPECIES: hypothetical protein [unclassified Microbacterium]|uniref:hypothetical protein n=1 Tax=unclassified Microbacterium TaxID=2609290 RepID=UPI003867A4AC